MGLTRVWGRTVIKTKANSPHIFFVVGLAGSVTSTVLACQATLKLQQQMGQIEESIEAAKHVDDPKDRAFCYMRAGLQVGRLYAPAAAVGVASIACLTGSHVTLTRRNAGLAAAYASLKTAYDELRKEVDDHNEVVGTAKSASDKSKAKMVSPDGRSPYARFFSELSSTEWKDDAELNRLYIQCQQEYATQLLLRRGHLFLNEVYDSLGIERTKEGAVVGWVYPSKDGDNYVSFGMYDPRNANFLDGSEPTILLDFNVDGVIYDLI